MTSEQLAVREHLVLPRQFQDLLFREARSASAFQDEPVSGEQLAAIYDLVKYGPTALNQQPLRLVALRSEQARRRLLPYLHGHNQQRAARAPLVVLLAADLNFHQRLPELFPAGLLLRDEFAGRPAERAAQARFNALLQAGYFIIGVRCAGLAAGPMTGMDRAAVNREFFPAGDLEALMVVNIGRPLPKTRPRLPRLPYQDVVRIL
ncbi:MAG: malonic semialdehyde reductase [Micromonosporaceae bacterium]|nr:malonic semialdehyde reductase [Micromonosporaceae bacterium]